MFKRILLVGAILAVNSTAVFAYGTYMGLSLGATSTSYTLKDAANETYDLNARYPTIGLFVGDGEVFKNRFYLAGEMFVSGGTGNTSYRNINNNTVAAMASSTYSYGADAIPGYVMGRNQETLVYGRLGISDTRIQLRGYLTPTGIAAGVNDTTTTPRMYVGGRFGFGVQHSFTPIIKARADYIHTSYRTLGVMDASGLRDRLTPSSNLLSVALVYEFV